MTFDNIKEIAINGKKAISVWLNGIKVWSADKTKK